MRIIFAGTPDLALPALQTLLNSDHQVVAVYTQPDRPSGRGQKLTASPVKQLAQTANIPVCQPLTLRDESEQKIFQHWQADIMVVIAYGLILPPVILSTPRFGCINIHVSLLPRWRGAAPIQRAILAGDAQTGVTIMQMAAGLDTGPILDQVSCAIHAGDTSQDLHDRLAILGADILLKNLADIEAGRAKPVLQNEAETCYAKKIEKAEGEINWQHNAEQLDRQVRAFNPWPVAYTHLGQELVRIWQAEPLSGQSNVAPGTIINADKQGIDVVTGNGMLRLLKIQLPGGRCLPVAEILHAKADLFSVGTQLRKYE